MHLNCFAGATVVLLLTATFGTSQLQATQPGPAAAQQPRVRFYATHLDGTAIIVDPADNRRVIADVRFRDVDGNSQGSQRAEGEAHSSFVDVLIDPNQALLPLEKLCLDVTVRVDNRQNASVRGLTIATQNVQLALPELSTRATTYCCARRCGLFRRR